jgi:RNA polymerase sigma factor (sigma-70 family)
MNLEALIHTERAALTARLASVLGGDVHAAEDVCQETFTRAWRHLPGDLEPEHRRAWLRRTATNLAIDELRRRTRRPTAPLDHPIALATAIDGAEPDAAREALAQLTSHERFVLLLRFDGGLAHAEIARLLDITEEAARKRVARARAAFLRAYRATRADSKPLVLLVAPDEPAGPYLRWLHAAGARVRHHAGTPSERELALADGLVLTGSARDLDSSLYGEPARALRGEPDLARDQADLAALRCALALDLPVVGVCRGHQLLNIASGGTLYQDVVLDRATADSHETGRHRLQTHAGSTLRALFGRSAEVHSEHHQAVRRLGRRLRITATADDGLVEVIERTDRRFALGLQWHPETDSGGRGDRVADAFVAAARAS